MLKASAMKDGIKGAPILETAFEYIMLDGIK